MTADDVPDISMANTKQQMLDAYTAMKALIEARDKDLVDARRDKERFRQEAAKAAAERAIVEDPVRRIHDLRASVGRELTGLAEQFEAETQAYARLKEAIAEKQAELQRIFEVETAATDLAALIEAHRQSKAGFEAEIAAAREAWARERQDYDAGRVAEREARERQRAWEQEEFEHALKRERAQRRAELEDELSELARDIAARREAFERETATRRETLERDHAAREAELERREREVTTRETRMAELETRVDSFPEVLRAEVDKAVKEATDRVRAETAGREALLTKVHEGERNVLESRIEALQQLVERQARQIDALTLQQEKAYDKVQDIASKAVEGARRSAPPMMSAPPSQPAGETGRPG